MKQLCDDIGQSQNAITKLCSKLKTILQISIDKIIDIAAFVNVIIGVLHPSIQSLRYLICIKISDILHRLS